MHFTPPTLVLLALAVACEPSPLPPDADALAARYAAARDAFDERCVLPQSLLGTFGREAEPTLASRARAPTSAAEIEAAFLASLADDRIDIDRAALDECVRLISEAPCPVDPDAFLVRTGCLSVFVGERDVDEGCASDGECAPGLFCDALADECGHCAANGGDRAIEPFDLCADPLCGLEEAPLVAGSPCITSCGAGPYAGLLCVEGTCVERAVADVGEGCDLSYASLFTASTLVHCRDSDFGSSACGDLDLGDALGPVCVDLREVSDVAPFVPGAAVVSAFVPGIPTAPLECAR